MLHNKSYCANIRRTLVNQYFLYAHIRKFYNLYFEKHVSQAEKQLLPERLFLKMRHWEKLLEVFVDARRHCYGACNKKLRSATISMS